MTRRERRNILATAACVLLVVGIDQGIKVFVKTHLVFHQPYRIFNWFYLFFTENKGMAFGMEVLGTGVLSLFRVILVGWLAWCLVKMVRRAYPLGFLVLLSMILAGAVGNIIDNLFYGLIFTESYDYNVASLVPFGQGYAGLMQGRVVDMFYFPLVEFDWPASFPLVGGSHFVFFSPVFNFADSAITVGAFAILLFYRRCLASFSNFPLLKP